jgi:hypothetical protein
MGDRDKPRIDVERWIFRSLLAAAAAVFVVGTIASRHEIVRYIKMSRM